VPAAAAAAAHPTASLSDGGRDTSGTGETQLHDVGELAIGVSHRLVVANHQAFKGVR